MTVHLPSCPACVSIVSPGPGGRMVERGTLLAEACDIPLLLSPDENEMQRRTIATVRGLLALSGPVRLVASAAAAPVIAFAAA